MTGFEMRQMVPARSSTPAPVNDTLPPLAFFNIARHTPTFVLNGIVHYPVETTQSSLMPSSSSHPLFHVETLVFELLPAQNLEEMEHQYTLMAADAIETFKTDYLKKVVDRRIKTLEATQRQVTQNDVLIFLTTCLIPKFKQMEMVDSNSEAENFMQPVYSRIKPMIDQPRLQLAASHNFLREILGQDAMIFDEVVYPLVSTTPTPGRDLLIQLNSRYCTPAIPGRLLDDVEITYQSRLCHALQAQALTESPERIQLLEELETEVASLLAMVQHNDGYLYQGQAYGIVGHRGHWIAYTEVPEYAIETADGSLYRFDATRVGVIVSSCQPKDVLTTGKAQVLTAYEHMFVSSRTAHNTVCMVKNATYYHQLHRMPLQDSICLYLHDAKYTLMAGYHAGNENTPHHPIGAFTHRRISRQDAVRRRLPIFSYAR